MLTTTNAPIWERFGCGPYEYRRASPDSNTVHVRLEGTTSQGVAVTMDRHQFRRGSLFGPLTTSGLDYVLPKHARTLPRRYGFATKR